MFAASFFHSLLLRNQPEKDRNRVWYCINQRDGSEFSILYDHMPNVARVTHHYYSKLNLLLIAVRYNLTECTENELMSTRMGQKGLANTVTTNQKFAVRLRNKNLTTSEVVVKPGLAGLS
jgi:hypothetical protein